MSKITFRNIIYSPNEIEYKKLEENRWEITNRLQCNIETSTCIKYQYIVNPGLTTDFRSGPNILNKLAPKIGPDNIAISWIIHDINYYGYISRLNADRLLYTMLINAGLSKWRSSLVYTGVRLFGVPGYFKKRDKAFVDFKTLEIKENIA